MSIIQNISWRSLILRNPQVIFSKKTEGGKWKEIICINFVIDDIQVAICNLLYSIEIDLLWEPCGNVSKMNIFFMAVI